MKYLKETATQGLILKSDPSKGIEEYMDADFAVIWNQEECKDPGLVLSKTGYIFTYYNCLVIWVVWLQTEIALSTMKSKSIAQYQVMRYVLTFVSLMKEIEFVLNIQVDTPTVMCNIFKNTVTVKKDS